MRTVLSVLILSLSAPGQPAAGPDARIAQVPDGKIEQRVYSNDAFEISFTARVGWTIALTPKGTAPFAPELSASDPVNKCSRALFSSEPARGESRPFGPKVTYYVFDPECFPGSAPMPKTVKDQKVLGAFALRVVNALAASPYIPPGGGADFGGFDAGKRAFVTLTGAKDVDSGAATTPPHKVHVNTLLTLTESGNYWLIMAAIVDDEAKKTLQTGAVGMSVRN